MIFCVILLLGLKESACGIWLNEPTTRIKRRWVQKNKVSIA